MKKVVKYLFVSILTVSLLVACGGGGSTADAKVKMGVASSQVVKVNDEGVEGKFNTVFAGVILKDDKVAYVSIDESEQTAKLVDGEITFDVQETKKDRGAEYGMINDSDLGKEWFEQVEAIEAALVGLSKDEVIAYFEGEEVKSAASFYVNQIQEAVVKAIDVTVEVEGVAKVGLGHALTVKDSESTVDYAFIAVDADGKIVKALLDNAQEKVKVDGDKLVAVEIGKTKGELKEAYGMVGASDIDKEWYEQNDAIMEKLVGMTVTEFNAYNADPKEEEDLKATVTMDIEAYQTALKDAEENLTDLK